MDVRPGWGNGLWGGRIKDNFVRDQVVFVHDVDRGCGEKEDEARNDEIDKRTDTQ